MIPQITARLSRAVRLTSAEIDRSVHFHLHSDGEPFACDVFRCESPGFTLAEIDQTATRSPR